MRSNRFIAALLFYSLTFNQTFSQHYADGIDDETAFKKLFYAKKAEDAISDGFIVVFNKTKVEEIRNSTLVDIVGNLSRSEGALEVERIDSLLYMVKLKVYTFDFDFASDEEAAKRERAQKL